VKKFFSVDPFRKLGLTVVLVIANEVVKSGLFPSGLTIAAQIFLAIAAVFGFGAGYASYRLKLYATRAK
jgi:hypothetical protein